MHLIVLVSNPSHDRSLQSKSQLDVVKCGPLNSCEWTFRGSWVIQVYPAWPFKLEETASHFLIFYWPVDLKYKWNMNRSVYMVWKMDIHVGTKAASFYAYAWTIQCIQGTVIIKTFSVDTQASGPSQYNDVVLKCRNWHYKISYIDNGNPHAWKKFFILKRGSGIYQRGGRRYPVSKCSKCYE